MMNTLLKYILTATVFTVCIQCKAKVITQTAEVTYLESKNEVLFLRSSGYGKSNPESLENAQRNAMEILLFRGIPGSQQPMPLVSINEKEKEDSKKYFEAFYNQGRYKTFITSIQPYTDYQSTNAGKLITVDLGVNLKSLRADLENNNIIRKFGY